jgi:hypothetical protein
MNLTLVCYNRAKVFTLCHIFKGFGYSDSENSTISTVIRHVIDRISTRQRYMWIKWSNEKTVQKQNGDRCITDDSRNCVSKVTCGSWKEMRNTERNFIWEILALGWNWTNCAFGLYSSSGVVISISDRVCVPLCVCVYFILVFWPPLRVVVCE